MLCRAGIRTDFSIVTPSIAYRQLGSPIVSVKTTKRPLSAE
jgi:hypothetical protein